MTRTPRSYASRGSATASCQFGGGPHTPSPVSRISP
jgi:hypothetical protein